MASQKDFEIIKSFQPLFDITRKPTDDALAVYCSRLARVTLDKIREAVDRIVDTWDRATFPPVALFLRECSVNTVSSSDPANNYDSALSWVIRDEKRAKMIKEFRDNFLESAFYKKAESEKWNSELYRYTMAIAWVQVQLIHQDKTGFIGYDNAILNVAHRINAFLNEQRQIAAGNSINVYVSDELMESWKARNELERQSEEREKERMSRKYGISAGEAANKLTQT